MNTGVIEISAFVTEGYYLFCLVFFRKLISYCVNMPLKYRNKTTQHWVTITKLIY